MVNKISYIIDLIFPVFLGSKLRVAKISFCCGKAACIKAVAAQKNTHKDCVFAIFSCTISDLETFDRSRDSP
jgi:iron-sulfur cluster repair protein YtfE (RIC family)